MKSLLAAIAIGIVVAILTMKFVVIPASAEVAAPSQRLEIAGTIRCCWYTLNDTGHTPLNITGVTAGTQGAITIHYPLVSKVGTLIVVPDETFARLGVTVGASVNKDKATIRCGRLGRTIDCNSLRPYTAGNFWIYGNMAM